MEEKGNFVGFDLPALKFVMVREFLGPEGYSHRADRVSGQSFRKILPEMAHSHCQAETPVASMEPGFRAVPAVWCYAIEEKPGAAESERDFAQVVHVVPVKPVFAS